MAAQAIGRSHLAGSVGGYRDAVGLKARVAALGERRRRELRQLDPQIAEIYAQRRGRIAGGIAGSAWAVSVFLGLAVAVQLDFEACAASAPMSLLLGWAVALVVYAIAFHVAKWRFYRELEGWLNERSYPERELARLEEESVGERARLQLGDLEVGALAWPMVMVSLALPLSLHVILMALMGFSGKVMVGWMLMSMVVVGHAHLFLAWCAARYAQALRAGRDEFMQGWRVYGWVIVASAIPGAILFLLPPIVVAVTGVAFIPWMFNWAERVSERERLLLEG